MNKHLEQLKQQYGITGQVAGFYSRKNHKSRREAIEAAMDAALETSPNIAVPAAMTAYVDTDVTSVLFDPFNATELFPEVKKGDWTAPYAIFKVREATGSIAPYGDFSPSGRSDVNYNFPTREQCRFQTIIEYGDFEEALTAEAKMNLVADKQYAAATTVQMAANFMYLFGVAGSESYGLLNDPNLNPAIAAAATGAGGGTKWDTKSTVAIYNDILSLFARLVEQNKNISPAMPVTLAVPPTRNVLLGRATDFNISVADMLGKYFKGGLKIVILPELEEADGDASCVLSVKEIKGEQVALCGFGEKYRLGRLVPDLSSFKQKAMFTTYGGVIKHVSCIATMTGI